MARLKSEEKRQAILDAATRAIAERGLAAPTAAIAKLAGVAEGSLFTYFADKDALFNELYLAIKRELHQWLSDGYPSQAPVAERLAALWDRYIAWGAARELQRLAMTQLAVSERITPATRAEGEAIFGEIGRLLEQGVAEGVLRAQPPGFSGAMVMTMAETTLGFMHRNPDGAAAYRQAGFDSLWRALAAR